MGFDGALGQQSRYMYPGKQNATDNGVAVWDTGADKGLESMPPYQVVDFIICAEGGIYPTRSN